ncbi:MAG: DegT/DnrJ/EryC1/StrS family aminotransferase [Acidimicrobiales bacterium]
MAAPEPIPAMDLAPGIDELRTDLLAAVEDVLTSARFILGPNVGAFETEVAAYLGVDHAVGVNSGTDALVIGLRALGVAAGDEVVTSTFTFFATAEATSVVGAQPVFVDSDPKTFNLDPVAVERAIGPRTSAIVPVHLFGQPADMDEIGRLASDHGLVVLEDAAQAMGADWGSRKAGTIGGAGAFSFFPSKNLGGFGDGGLLATDDADVAERARMLRSHGGRRKYHNEMLGYNSRLDELQAALLRRKLPRLDAANAGRRRVAARYDAALAGVGGVVRPVVGSGLTHVFHQYTVRVPAARRDDVAARLRQDGIATMVYYPVPVHLLPVYRGQELRLPEAERAAGEVLSLPIWPEMTDAHIDRVVTSLDQALA